MNKTKNLQQNSVIVITGPTASGKTLLAIELAKLLNTEIISADSRQVYKLMDICTAKPSRRELNEVKHHLVDFLSPNEDYSAGVFTKDANKIILQLHSLNKLPIVCGGTGFYIKSLFEGLFVEKEPDNNINFRNELNNRFTTSGLEELRNELKNLDLDSYNQIDIRNPHRVIRALEYFYTTGESLVKAHGRRIDEIKLNPIYFAIDYPRQELYDRINSRCDEMWSIGLVKEYENLLSLGYKKHLNSLNTVGYKEVEKYLNGILNENQAIEEFKKNTRRFAKRQLTWFRKNNKINWIDCAETNPSNIIIEILEKL